MPETPVGPAFWRSFSIFEGYGEAALSELNRIAIGRNWSAGEVLFQRGDEGDHVIAVATGRIKLSLLTQSGRELTLRHAGPGEILGELSLLDGQPRSADATASVLSTGRAIRKDDFARLLQAFPEVQPLLITYLCQRLRETTDQLESIALFEVEARLARFLLLTIRQTFGDDDIEDAPRLRLDLNQGEIAGMLGASRPKVNRAIVALETAGAIHRDGAVLTCNIDLLGDFAEPNPA